MLLGSNRIASFAASRTTPAEVWAYALLDPVSASQSDTLWWVCSERDYGHVVARGEFAHQDKRRAPVAEPHKGAMAGTVVSNAVPKYGYLLPWCVLDHVYYHQMCRERYVPVYHIRHH